MMPMMSHYQKIFTKYEATEQHQRKQSQLHLYLAWKRFLLGDYTYRRTNAALLRSDENPSEHVQFPETIGKNDELNR